ncbi:MAG: hypothetical protein H0T54_06845, partial [Geodermatophilaceae bacterium]|nr:hypothetical protein [Geodermatophilaceae bacterium]
MTVLVRALLLVALAASATRAQQPMPGAPPAPRDSLTSGPRTPPFEAVNGTLLRTDARRYTLSLVRAAGAVSLGVRTVTVVEGNAGGRPVWTLMEAREGTVVATYDTLQLARADLSPVRWSAVNGRALLGVSFSRDSMYGATLSYQGRSSFTAAVPPGVLVTPAMLERVVELLPLRDGYRTGATLLLVETGTMVPLAADIVVDGRDEIERDGGRDACWRVAIRSG